jgi:UDP-N-acetylglucosamine 2-epimerase
MKKLKVLTIVDTRPKITRLSRVMAVPDASETIEALHHGHEFEFSGGFTELHTRSYEHILEGNGFRITEAEKAIQTVYNIRHQKPLGLKGDYHPLAKLPLAKHPFEANK